MYIENRDTPQSPHFQVVQEIWDSVLEGLKAKAGVQTEPDNGFSETIIYASPPMAGLTSKPSLPREGCIKCPGCEEYNIGPGAPYPSTCSGDDRLLFKGRQGIDHGLPRVVLMASNEIAPEFVDELAELVENLCADRLNLDGTLKTEEAKQ